jgi:hypothetical protein
MNNSKVIVQSQFEDLPNELFYKIQSYLIANDLYEAFSNLNSRFDDLLMSINNLHFEIRSSVENQRLRTGLFASRIISISVPNDSDAASIATIFPNVRSLIFHRAIRLIPTTLPMVERIKLDLSCIRPKQAVGLCLSIFSNHFPCLSSLHIFHGKCRVIGHWNPLINSIRHSCPTLTEFIFDIRPTVEWKMVEHFLNCMPHLQRLIIRKLNTRNRWTLSNIGETLKKNVPDLDYLFICITSLGTTKVVEIDDNYHFLHPLFIHIRSKKGNSRKLCSTTTITSRIH